MCLDMSEYGFDTLLQKAYTHGFENIYALENVDPRSIRLFQNASAEAEKRPKKARIKNTDQVSFQLEFDLGLGFQNFIEPFYLYESIQVLELSKFSEKILEQHFLKVIKDLLGYNFGSFVQKGIGQGHIDEIQLKLKNYLVDKDNNKSYWIDFASFVRSLFGGISKKKIYVYLQEHNMQEMITLSSADVMEVKRLLPGKREEWVQEVQVHLTHPNQYQFVHAKIKEITLNFCVPWMEKRCGFACIDEILTSLEGISIDPSLTEKSFIFLSQLYFTGHFPVEPFLKKTSEGIFAVDLHFYNLFYLIQTQALSYFYKNSTSYLLDDLIHWLNREFAKQWKSIGENMIIKVLLLSPEFYIWKNSAGMNEIRLA